MATSDNQKPLNTARPEVWHLLENQQNTHQELISQLALLQKKVTEKQEDLCIIEKQEFKVNAEVELLTEQLSFAEQALKKAEELRRLRKFLSNFVLNGTLNQYSTNNRVEN